MKVVVVVVVIVVLFGRLASKTDFFAKNGNGINPNTHKQKQSRLNPGKFHYSTRIKNNNLGKHTTVDAMFVKQHKGNNPQAAAIFGR